MKGKKFHFGTVAATVLALAALLPGVSRADYLQAHTPFDAGAPPAAMFSQGSASGSLFGRPNVVWGSSLRVDSLSLSSRGSVTIQLRDLHFPLGLDSLSMLVTDLHGLFKRIDGPGDLLVDLSGPAQLFVAVFARTDNRSTPGLYAVTTTQVSAVPLPAAAWLLLSGLGGLAAVVRRRRT